MFGSFSFDGVAKDMWKLETEFDNDLSELNKKRKQDELKRISNQINNLEQQRKQLLNELSI